MKVLPLLSCAACSHNSSCVTSSGMFTTQSTLNLIPRLLLQNILTWLQYRKILKISPRAYIFQRPFWRGLFLEGLIFGGVYLRREICVSKSIGLALQLEVKLPFLLCFTLYLRAIFQVQAPGGLIFGGGIWRRAFCITSLGGLYLEGLIFGILRYPPNGQFAFWLHNNQCNIVHMSIPDNSHLKRMV